MKRCHFCKRLIWPWQRRGWIVGVMDWHAACRRREMVADPAPWPGYFSPDDALDGGHSER